VHKPLMPDLAALAEQLDVRLHTHLMQVEDEERYSVEAHGLRPVDFLESVGWLKPRVWLAHAVHFNADDIVRLGEAGVGVCHLAAADMLLAAGICPVKDFEAAGSPIGLGVDGSSSNDSSNMMEAVRHSLMLQRLKYGASRVTHQDALRWATEGGAKCLGRDDIGRIAVGGMADLALFTLDAPRFSGAHDPLAALVLCGAHRADRVMVNGDWRVIDGHPVGIDLAALLAEHREAARKFS
jgi:8-oxoguanine deaminase